MAWFNTQLYKRWASDRKVPLWESCRTWFAMKSKPPTQGCWPRFSDGRCTTIVFPMGDDSHWTVLIANVPTETMWYFNGYGDKPRSLTAPPIKGNVFQFFLAVTAVLNLAGEQAGGDKQLCVKWKLECYYGDRIPKQMDGWSCGYRVLLIADMLALGYEVDDLRRLYGHDDMLSTRQAMGHFLLSVGSRVKQ
jgi:hypothetical protein